MRKAIVAVSLVAAGGLLWLLAGSWDRLPEDPIRPALAADAVGEAADAGVPTAGDPFGTREGVPASQPDAQDGARPPRPGFGSRNIRVLVVEKGTLRPVAGADVLFASLSEHDRLSDLMRRMDDGSADIEAQLAKSGRKARTDDEGRATLELVPTWQRIAARAGELYGETMLHCDHEPIDGFRVEVERDVALRVRAVHPSGAPGAGVAIVALWKAKHPGGAVHDLINQLGKTDEHGGFVVTHAQTRCWGVAADADGHRRMRLALASHAKAAAHPVIDLDAPPAEPIVLTLPATGSVAVEVCEPDGSPATGSGWVHLESTPAGEVLVSPSSEIKRATVTLRHVPLGRTWKLQANFYTRNAQQDLQGPRFADETVQARIVLPVAGIRLVGRALDTGRAPLADRRLNCWVRETGKANAQPAWTATDGHGRFRLQVPEAFANKPCDVLVELFQETDAARTGMQARVHLPHAVTGEHDVGDLVLAPAALLAVVRCTGGDPASDASLRLEVQRRRPNVTAEKDAWQRDDTFSVLRTADDRFEVRGEPAPCRVRLNLWSSLHQRVPPMEVDLPARDELRIALERGGSLVARIAVGQPAGYIWFGGFQAIRTDGLQVEPATANQMRMSDGQFDFEWPGLAAGTYRVELALRPGTRPILVVDDVTVRAGERTADPRLLPIDLREVLRRITVRVRDADGKPLSGWGNSCEPLEPDGKPARALVSPSAEAFVVLLADAAVNLRIRATGHRPQFLEQVSKDVDVTLRKGPVLRAVCPKDPPKLPAGRSYMIGLGQVARKPQLDQRQPLSEQGDVSFPLHGGGEWYVELGVSTSRGWRTVSGAVVSVPDDATEHRHEIAVTAAQWEAAVQEAGR